MVNHRIFSEVITEFVKDRKMKAVAKGTLEYYQRYGKALYEYLNDDPIFESITSTQLKDFFMEYSVKHNQGGVHSAYRSIKAIFNFYAFEYEPEGWKNPIKKVKIRPPHNPPLPEIPLADVQKLLLATKKDYHPARDQALIYLMIDTGCRGSEVVSLNIKDIDLVNGSVYIWHGKGDTYRIVFIGEKSRKKIKEYLSTRPLAKPEDPLFMSQYGNRLCFIAIQQQVRRLCEKANINRYGLHAFRRCFALTMFRKTHDIFLISRLLGHEQVETTRRYLNINNEDLLSILQANSPGDMLI
jgi:site-specific recombinase XerD